MNNSPATNNEVLPKKARDFVPLIKLSDQLNKYYGALFIGGRAKCELSEGF